MKEDGYIEIDPKYIGTYNYCIANGDIISDTGHTIFDVIPWILYGNSLEDGSSILDRLIMVTSEPQKQENN